MINPRARGAVSAIVWRFQEKTHLALMTSHTRTYVGHYEKSLCSENDLRCYWRKMKIISSDWIALSCMLLIHFTNIPGVLLTKLHVRLIFARKSFPVFMNIHEVVVNKHRIFSP